MTNDGDVGAAWDEYCEALRTLGRAVLDGDEASDEGGRAEGVRYLARLTAMTLVQSLDFADPADPRFFRGNDDVWQWGGPNVDNVYLGAPVDPRGTYRLTGDLGGQPGVILQVLGRPAGDDPIAVRVDRSLGELADADGLVDVLLGPDVDEAVGVRLPPDAQRVMLREYVPSSASARAGFVIERVDDVVVRGRVTEREVVRALGSSRRWLEHHVPFWQAYTARRRAEVGVNRIEQPGRGEGMGSNTIVYSAGFFALEQHECLLITVERPVAPYWAMQLYSLGWYEGIDASSRQSSLNHTQIHVDADGAARFVVALVDPGVPNWLDTGGHAEGMLHFRAVWCTSSPAASAEVVPLDEIRTRLPADHPVTTPAQRADALRARRRDAQRRFCR